MYTKELSLSKAILMVLQTKTSAYVVHELCHRRHMNHSKEFYAEIASVFPDYKRCKPVCLTYRS